MAPDEGQADRENAVGEVSYKLTEKVKANRKFTRSLFVVKDIKAGEIFTEENVRSIRLGFGLHPKYIADVIGKISAWDLIKGTPFELSFINIANYFKNDL